MTISSYWPTNKYGTTWRRAVMYYDWSDEQVVSEVLEAIDPREITVRCWPVAAIGFDNIEEMVMYRLAEPLPYGNHWDQENLAITIDPCSHPEVLQRLIEVEMPTVRFSVFGVAVLDLANETILRQLSAALEERHGRFVGQMPVIEF